MGRFWTILEPFLATFWGPGGLPGASPKESRFLKRFLIDFGSLLEPLLGTMLRQNGPPKLSKITFFSHFSPFRKACIFQKLFEKPLGAS